MKKLCAVLLFVFVATLLVSSAAFATIKHRVDSQDLVLITRNALRTNIRAVSNLNNLVEVFWSSDQALPGSGVGHNHYDGINGFGPGSNDYDLLKLSNAAAGAYFNVPDRVIDILSGGVGVARTFADDPSDLIGYTVSPDHTLDIVRRRSDIPVDGTGVMIEDREAAIVRVYVWSADIRATGNNTVVVPVRLNARAAANSASTTEVANYWTHSEDHSRFAGMRVRDIKLLKVHGSGQSGASHQTFFERVESIAALDHMEDGNARFVVLFCDYNPVTGVPRERVMTGDEVIGATGHYRIAYAVRNDVANFDFTTAGSHGYIVDPVIIFAEWPYVVHPRFASATHPVPTVHNAYAWRFFANNVAPATDAEGVAVAGVDNTGGFGTDRNDFLATARDIFGLSNGMMWVTDAAITDSYGFDLDAVHKFPAAIAEAEATQHTTVVMFPIRCLEAFVGRRVSDVSVINATGVDFASPQRYQFVDSHAALVDGRFAVLNAAAKTDTFPVQHRQAFMSASDEFEEGGVYFVALAVKDGGDFDVQQGTQGIANSKNDRAVHISAFAVVDAAPPVVPTLVVGPATRTAAPGDTIDLSATRSDTGAAVNVEWSSSDEAVATVDEDGLFTAVAVGTVEITATPVAPATTNVPDEDLDPVTVTFTVAQDAPPVGGSSGGCSVGGFAPATLLLLAPLFLLLKK